MTKEPTAKETPTKEQDNEIIVRWQGRQSMRGIARDLGISRWRVRRVVGAHTTARDDGALSSDLPARPLAQPKSKLDAFETKISQLLARYPEITATRVFEELRREGYTGGYTILRDRVKRMRPQPNKPLVVRFETDPGVQAQMDWAVYDINFSGEGRRRVNLFGYLLSYSRREYLCFTERQDFDATVRQHILAFKHLQGLAATCLFENMKGAVTRWEDDQPIYNTRFLAFATHYGYRPWACQPRRPETKGKVERHFHYVEKSLLNGRTFRNLEHLNEVTRWWLANVADVRIHRGTKKRPIDAHAEEQSHLLSLPTHDYDTARVVYRIVDSEGFIQHENNGYSAPWQRVGEVLPVRVTESELIIYDRRIKPLGRHLLLSGQTGKKQEDPRHRPPKNHRRQLEQVRQRFRELGDIADRFLEGLLKKQRYGRRQAQRVLLLLGAYDRADGLAAMERAVRYHAYSLSSLERILTMQATPKASWRLLGETQQDTLRKLSESDSIDARSSTEYQYLLFEENDSDDTTPDQRPDASRADPSPLGDAQDPADA
jgi:transposase